MQENFTKIKPDKLRENPFQLIGQQWMLVTAGTLKHWNTLTASWGGMGVLWNRNVCFAFIRPSRYTYEFIEEHEDFTLSFFAEKYREALRYCGSHSGREVDKAAQT